MFRRFAVALCWLRLKWAERALYRPFDQSASLRLDLAFIALERAREAVL